MKTEFKLSDLIKSTSWNFYPFDLRVEIRMSFEISIRGREIPKWTYYVYIYESKCPIFGKLWLKDKKTSWGITHDYGNTLLSNCGWHGGVTWYQKYHNKKGKRHVCFGCDYSHYYDVERVYTLEDVFSDAARTACEINNVIHNNL